MHIIFISFLLGIQLQVLDAKENPSNFDFERFKLLLHKEDSIYLSRMSGIVYQRKQGKLKRIDNSYDDKIHTASLDFFYKDTLYRFGGYGYFTTNKNLIYFDQTTSQWDMVKYNGFKKIDPFSSVGIHFIKNDQLYVMGYDTHEKEFQNESNFLTKGFSYDFKEKNIADTFNIRADFEFPRAYVQVNENYVFLFYPNHRKVKIVNTSSFDLFNYNLNQVESSIINKHNEDFLLEGDQLKFKIKNIDREIIPHSINIKSVINNMELEGNLLIEKPSYGYWLLLLIPLLALLTFIKLNKKESVELRNKQLYFRKKTINLNEKMCAILEILLQNKEVSSAILNDIFFKEGHNPIHINREKNNNVDRINLLFQLHFNENLILKKKSELDKRMMLYFINPKFTKQD